MSDTAMASSMRSLMKHNEKIQRKEREAWAEVTQLRRLLLHYGHHPSGCRVLLTGDCDCGWPEARDAARAALEVGE